MLNLNVSWCLDEQWSTPLPVPSYLGFSGFILCSHTWKVSFTILLDAFLGYFYDRFFSQMNYKVFVSSSTKQVQVLILIGIYEMYTFENN